MRIIFCGPPHSGKSVLVANLENRLPADSFKTIRVSKDGEGIWSNNPNQEEVQLVRVKESYGDVFIKLKCDEIMRAEQQIILVDIGGRLSSDKIPIFKACDSFVILSNDRPMIEQWKKFGIEQNCCCLAEIYSVLNGTEYIEKSDVPLQAVAAGLERGKILENSKVLDCLASLIIEKSTYRPLNFQDTEVFNFNKLAQQLDCCKNTGIIKNVNFSYKDSFVIYKEIYSFAFNLKTHSLAIDKSACIKIFGARANWCSALAVKASFDANMDVVELYDTGFAKYIPVRTSIVKKQMSDLEAQQCIEVNFLESKNEVFIDLFNLQDVLSELDMEKITLPEIPSEKRLYLSGKLPNWFICSVLFSYSNMEKYLFQPGKGFVCVDSVDVGKLGSFLESPLELDIETFFINRKNKKQS